MMKLYLYNSKGIYLHEIEACEGITYHNSTEVEPPLKGKDPTIYQAVWNSYTKTWSVEYKPDFVEKKAKELNLEIATISTMSEDDLRSGKLPALNKMQEAYLEAKGGAKSTKTTKRRK